MTKLELQTLDFFREGERTLAGDTIDWTHAEYRTMWWLNAMRRLLDAPIKIIRVVHPGKPTAIDWCCPSLPYGQVVAAVLRIPMASYGFYSGNSVHLDFREFEYFPARWLAIRPHERNQAIADGMQPFFGELNDEWQYLAWDWRALQYVVTLAESQNRDKITVDL